MHQLLSKLVIYKHLEKDSILFSLGNAFKQLDKLNSKPIGSLDYTKEDITSNIYTQINRLLDLATEYGFNDNLWHNYLTFILITNENPFSITCEKERAKIGSVNQFVKSDFRVFKQLFDYDFSKIEKELDINCFQIISNYQAIKKNGKRYNKSVSKRVQLLSKQIEEAKKEEEIFSLVTSFYKEYGVGTLGLNKAFRINHIYDKVIIEPITNTDDIRLDDLIGYEIQKKKLIENTESFVQGKKANNVLLFGDSGTGKSSSVKAILNEYYSSGLRMIELYKHQFKDLSALISQIKNRNYKFIIFMDDLSFEEFEIEYKYLKAVIEGGLETRPDNVLIYATSNRRHLIRETWSDRSDISKDELHRSDTMQEKLSLVARFGITINYSSPTQKEYINIVNGLVKTAKEITLPQEEIERQAKIWEMSHGGLSGRTARQFINYLAGQSKAK